MYRILFLRFLIGSVVSMLPAAIVGGMLYVHAVNGITSADLNAILNAALKSSVAVYQVSFAFVYIARACFARGVESKIVDTFIFLFWGFFVFLFFMAGSLGALLPAGMLFYVSTVIVVFMTPPRPEPKEE